MAPPRSPSRLLSLAAALLIAGCSLQPSVDRAESSTTGPDFRVIHFGEAGSSSIELSVDAGSNESDIFVIFTNPGAAGLTAPVLRTGTGTSSSLLFSAGSSGESRASETRSFESLDTLSGQLRERTEQAGVGRTESNDESQQQSLRISGSVDYKPGDTEKLWGLVSATLTSNEFDEIAACAAAVVAPTASRPGTVVWIETEGLGDPVPDGECDAAPTDADQGQAKRLAEAFMDPADDDLYTAVTDIYGSAWGSTPSSSLIGEDQRYIHIFLFDIARAGFSNGSADDAGTGGFIGGYFFALDTYLNSSLSSEDRISNERLILYLHGPAFAHNEEDEWALYDYWPGVITQTAAHEFQHLINWYEKSARRGRSARSDVWLDELMSLMTEEFTGELLRSRFSGGDENAFSDPRGVAPNELGPGSSKNVSGRLPLFNYWNMRNVTAWGGSGGVLPDYAASYAFGAWLTRNFGGVRLMRSVMDNTYTDTRAITEGVRRQGRGGYSFAELLERWAASVVLSDRTVPVTGYRYRAKTGFSSSKDSTSVVLGSIDLQNYRYSGTVNGEEFDLDGPLYFTASNTFIDDFGSGATQAGYSNVYYAGPQGVRGTVSLEMSQSPSTRVSVVIRERK